VLTPKQSGWFMLAWFSFQIVLALLAGLIGTEASALWQGVLGLAGNLVPVLLAYIIYRIKRGHITAAQRAVHSFIPMNRPKIDLLIYAAALGILVQPAAMLISALSSAFDSGSIETINQIAAESPPAAALAALAVIPAITEELVARGVALNGFKGVSPVKAALVNGLIFGLMHMNLRQFFYAFALGALLAMLVIKGGNVIYAVIVHFVLNASQISLVPAIFSIMSEEAAAMGYLLVLPLSVWGVIVIYRHFGRKAEEQTREGARAFGPGLLIYVILSGLIMVSEFL
jgi:membrane protease YdiL (CAAX protease family)